MVQAIRGLDLHGWQPDDPLFLVSSQSQDTPVLFHILVMFPLTEAFSSQLESAKTDLHNCIRDHQDLCNRQRRDLRHAMGGNHGATEKRQEPQDLRVIDVHTLRVVQRPPGCQYAALSYVWEQPSGDQTQSDPSILGSESSTNNDVPRPIDLGALPTDVADAIQICAIIGETYLWVDAVCIFQNDKDDVATHIVQMDKIYSGAVVTFVAATDDDPHEGMPGLRAEYSATQLPLQKALDKTLWSSRGWTYQELVLSRRLLFFTSQGIYFHCAGRGHELPSWDLPSIAPRSCWQIYNQSLQIYTTRHLGHESDTLNAISGVQRVFGRYTDDAFACGLPMRQLFYAILWQPVDIAERQPDWPSWSWAGWTGSGQQLCHVITPVHEAVLDQWGDSAAKQWENGRAFHSRLENLRFCSEDGDEIPISLYPDNESRKHYLSYSHGVRRSESRGPATDRPY